MAISDDGRLFAMYNMNLDNITRLPDGAPCTRTDELGHFVMKYSDDGGRTWSKDRYEVPYRKTSIDTHNSWNGKVKTMWCVDQVKRIDGTSTVIYGFTKIGAYVQNAPQELWFMSSSNLLTERNASKITWNLYPDGDHGLLPPGVTNGPPVDQKGDILEEAHIVPLAQGGFYAVGRTQQGFLAAAATNATVADGLGGWSATGYAAYWDVAAADQNPAADLVPIPTATPVRGVGSVGYGLKNPRGPITPKRMANGMYLLLFYNNAGDAFGQRDPYWLACGIENKREGILWSQPEIVLYDRFEHSAEAGGYPDFIQSETNPLHIYITETQKSITRIHKIESRILEALFAQRNVSGVHPNPAATFGSGSKSTAGHTAAIRAPVFGSIGQWTHAGQGFTIDFVLDRDGEGTPGQAILDARTSTGRGVAVMTGTNHSIVLHLSDGDGVDAGADAPSGPPPRPPTPMRSVLQTDPLCSAVLAKAGKHHVGIVVDAGPMVATFIVDGLVCDGGHAGSSWGAGWFWLPPLRSLNGADTMSVGRCNSASASTRDSACTAYAGRITNGHVYNSALLNSEVIGNFRATHHPHSSIEAAAAATAAQSVVTGSANWTIFR